MKVFTMYRKNMTHAPHNENQKNPPEIPQFEGCIFSDGRVAVRWLTPIRSISVWDNLDDLLAIHGHPEYESELIFKEIKD